MAPDGTAVEGPRRRWRLTLFSLSSLSRAHAAVRLAGGGRLAGPRATPSPLWPSRGAATWASSFVTSLSPPSPRSPPASRSAPLPRSAPGSARRETPSRPLPNPRVPPTELASDLLRFCKVVESVEGWWQEAHLDLFLEGREEPEFVEKGCWAVADEHHDLPNKLHLAVVAEKLWMLCNLLTNQEMELILHPSILCSDTSLLESGEEGLYYNTPCFTQGHARGNCVLPCCSRYWQAGKLLFPLPDSTSTAGSNRLLIWSCVSWISALSLRVSFTLFGGLLLLASGLLPAASGCCCCSDCCCCCLDCCWLLLQPKIAHSSPPNTVIGS